MIENVLRHGYGGSVLVHIGMVNDDMEGTTRIVQKCRELVGTLKKVIVKQIILSRIVPIMGGRGATFTNCKQMAINTSSVDM
jgi:hypothetical protein